MVKDTVEFIKGFDLHTIIIVGVAFWYLNGSLGSRLDDIEERLTKIEVVLVCKKIMPESIAKKSSSKHLSFKPYHDEVP